MNKNTLKEISMSVKLDLTDMKEIYKELKNTDETYQEFIFNITKDNILNKYKESIDELLKWCDDDNKEKQFINSFEDFLKDL